MLKRDNHNLSPLDTAYIINF